MIEVFDGISDRHEFPCAGRIITHIMLNFGFNDLSVIDKCTKLRIQTIDEIYKLVSDLTKSKLFLHHGLSRPRSP